MRNFLESKKLLDKSTLFYLTATTLIGNYFYVNEKFATAFSRTNNDFIGQSFSTLMHPDDIKKCATMQTKCFDNIGKAFNVIIRNQNTKGSYIYTQWECNAMFDDNENSSGIYCVGSNISKYLAHQIELKDAQKENREKRAIIKEITFQLSHLVRNPSTNTIGLANLLLDEQLLKVDPNSTRVMILESTNQLDEIIKSIVKVSSNSFTRP